MIKNEKLYNKPLVSERWDFELENMPGFELAMQRVYAWYDGEIIDRPPVRFVAHNAFVEQANQVYPSPDLRDRWFDAEFQVATFLKAIEGQTFRAETFPVFWPNLGPEVYAAFYGAELQYGEVTSWSKPMVIVFSSKSRDWKPSQGTESSPGCRSAISALLNQIQISPTIWIAM